MTYFSVIIRDLLDSVFYTRLQTEMVEILLNTQDFPSLRFRTWGAGYLLCEMFQPGDVHSLEGSGTWGGWGGGTKRNISIVNVKFSLIIFFAALNHHFRISTYLPAYLPSMALQSFVGPWPLFQFLNPTHCSVGLLEWGISPSQGLYIYTEQHKQNKRRQTSMPRVGFEPTTPVFEGAKRIHASDGAATVILLYIPVRIVNPDI
jgi:hypothetical protein